MARKRKPNCAWCPTPTESVTVANIKKKGGKGMHLVDVCAAHNDMIEREKGAREREAAKKKEPFVPYW
jgi:hypothetical protein